MAPDVDVPPPSSQEKALQEQQAALLSEQTSILQQQRQLQQALLPILGQQYGFEFSFDEQGNVTGVTETDPESRERRSEILKLEEERSLAALKGDLPVDPVLERNIEQQEQTLRERLERQFGPGYETSTPGIETLDQFFQSSEGLRYGARTGQLTLAEQLALARQGSELSSGGAAGSFSNATLGQQLGLAGAFGQGAAGYGQAQQGYQFDRQLRTSGSIAQEQLMQKFYSGIGDLAGTALFAPTSGTAAGALFSDSALKENIVKVGDTYHGLGIYKYNLKGDSVPRLGFMAEEVAVIRPDAVAEKDGFLTVDYRVL
jgi:hypothetical protein